MDDYESLKGGSLVAVKDAHKAGGVKMETTESNSFQLEWYGKTLKINEYMAIRVLLRVSKSSR